MATTIAHPSDPVTNGATEIQATTFNPVAADYASLSWDQAQNFMRGKTYKVNHFPKSATPDPTWSFYVRKDMVGASASNRNLIGVHVVVEPLSQNVFSGAVGGQITVPILQTRIDVWNWFPVELTLTDGTKVTRFNGVNVSYLFTHDPEGNTLLYGDGAHRVVTEAQGFLLNQVAANKPGANPALAAISGIFPL